MTQINSIGKRWLRLILILPAIPLIIGNALGQTTQFTYQGRLTDAGNPAGGFYDFQFKLFDSADFVTGIQQGPTINLASVQVENGVFTVELDFGAGVFTGAARFLEIGIRPAGSPAAFNVLSPRQPVTATPYAVRSATAATADTATNAAQLNGLTAGGFIQNTTTEQSATNFNIGGTGTASVLNAQTQFNLGGSRILSNVGTDNLFAGVGAGQANTTGGGNSFFGASAGGANTGGEGNSFFGRRAGGANTTGGSNAFFGTNTGFSNTTGTFNSFFGRDAGFSNTTGGDNSFFGSYAGGFNTTGSGNAFFGSLTGNANTTGISNTFIGAFAGDSNTTGFSNTIIGHAADVGANNLSFATAIGSGAVVNTSNTIVLGRNADTVQIPGILNATTQFNLGGLRMLAASGPFNDGAGFSLAATNTFLGEGAGLNTAPDPNTSFPFGKFNSFFGANAGKSNNTGRRNAFFGTGAGQANTIGQANAFFGSFAGSSNTTGFENSFFGDGAGGNNTSGKSNAFFGGNAGLNNTSGSDNTFIGNFAGGVNTTGSRNTTLGYDASMGGTFLTNATAIGAMAQVDQSDSLVLGSINGINGATTNANVGIGTTTPSGALTVRRNWNGLTGNILLESDSPTINFSNSSSSNSWIIHHAGLDGSINFHVYSGGWGLPKLSIHPGGAIYINNLGGSGGTPLCRNSEGYIGACSSSLRYKKDVAPYAGGLDVAMRLRPVSYAWKDDGRKEIGFAAEEVAEVEPRLTFKNKEGDVEGVNYGNITTVLVNAVRQQQAQIAKQQEEIKQQQAQIDLLKKLVCADHPEAEICKPAK